MEKGLKTNLRRILALTLSVAMLTGMDLPWSTFSAYALEISSSEVSSFEEKSPLKADILEEIAPVDADITQEETSSDSSAEYTESEIEESEIVEESEIIAEDEISEDDAKAMDAQSADDTEANDANADDADEEMTGTDSDEWIYFTDEKFIKAMGMSSSWSYRNEADKIDSSFNYIGYYYPALANMAKKNNDDGSPNPDYGRIKKSELDKVTHLEIPNDVNYLGKWYEGLDLSELVKFTNLKNVSIYSNIRNGYTRISNLTLPASCKDVDLEWVKLYSDMDFSKCEKLRIINIHNTTFVKVIDSEEIKVPGEIKGLNNSDSSKLTGLNYIGISDCNLKTLCLPNNLDGNSDGVPDSDGRVEVIIDRCDELGDEVDPEKEEGGHEASELKFLNFGGYMLENNSKIVSCEKLDTLKATIFVDKEEQTFDIRNNTGLLNLDLSYKVENTNNKLTVDCRYDFMGKKEHHFHFTNIGGDTDAAIRSWQPTYKVYEHCKLSESTPVYSGTVNSINIDDSSGNPVTPSFIVMQDDYNKFMKEELWKGEKSSQRRDFDANPYVMKVGQTEKNFILHAITVDGFEFDADYKVEVKNTHVTYGNTLDTTSYDVSGGDHPDYEVVSVSKTSDDHYKIEAKNPGEAKITVTGTYGGSQFKTETIPVYVYVPVESISANSIGPHELEVVDGVGEGTQLDYTMHFVGDFAYDQDHKQYGENMVLRSMLFSLYKKEGAKWNLISPSGVGLSITKPDDNDVCHDGVCDFKVNIQFDQKRTDLYKNGEYMLKVASQHNYNPYTIARYAGEEHVIYAEPVYFTVSGVKDPVDPVPDDPVPGKDHIHTIVADDYVAPTCEKPGKSAGSHCSTCRQVIKAQKEIAPLGHNLNAGIITVEPTVEKSGVMTYKCLRVGCGYTKEVTIPSIKEAEDVVGEDSEILANPEKPVTDTTINVVGVKTDNTYTGKAITFDVRVYAGKTLLKEGSDYSVKYVNNKTVPASDAAADKKPAVIITGKGSYSDKSVYNFEPVYFNINPINLSNLENTGDAVVSNTVVAKAAKSKLIKPVPTITVDGKKLTKKDYDVSYGEGNDSGIDSSVVGVNTITLTGKGNYTGTLISTYEVVEKSVPLLSKASVTGFKKNLPYNNGSAVTQSDYTVKLKIGKTNTELVEGTDYTVSYIDNCEVGTATMIINAKDGNDKEIVGEKVLTFKVGGTAMSKLTYTYDKKVDYTAAMIKPGLAGQPSLVLHDKKANKDLEYGTDYEVSYSKNIQAGNATMTFTGKGIYTGTVKKTFKIVAVDLGKNESVAATLVPGSVKLETDGKLKGKYTAQVEVTYKGKVLKSGKDYMVTFKNNTQPGSAADGNKAPQVIIKGKGNYTKTKSVPFDIVE